MSFLPDFLVSGCVLGTENSQASELTGDGRGLSLCGDVNTEDSGDRQEHLAVGMAQAEPPV